MTAIADTAPGPIPGPPQRPLMGPFLFQGVISMSELVTLIVCIAWPVVIGGALYVFRVPISTVIASISNRSFKLGTQGFEASIPPQQTAVDTSASQQGLQPTGTEVEAAPGLGIAKHFGVPLEEYVSEVEKGLDEAIPHLMRQYNFSKDDAIKYAAVDHAAALRLERVSRIIFGSQIDAINLLTSFGGRIQSEALRSIYNNAVPNFPSVYTNYSFEQWLAFLINASLIRIDGSDVIATPAGKAIVPYMQGWGYLNIRPLG
jgi:hypothetical protein